MCAVYIMEIVHRQWPVQAPGIHHSYAFIWIKTYQALAFYNWRHEYACGQLITFGWQLQVSNYRPWILCYFKRHKRHSRVTMGWVKQINQRNYSEFRYKTTSGSDTLVLHSFFSMLSPVYLLVSSYCFPGYFKWLRDTFSNISLLPLKEPSWEKKGVR